MAGDRPVFNHVSRFAPKGVSAQTQRELADAFVAFVSNPNSTAFHELHNWMDIYQDERNAEVFSNESAYSGWVEH